MVYNLINSTKTHFTEVGKYLINNSILKGSYSASNDIIGAIPAYFIDQPSFSCQWLTHSSDFKCC